MERFNVTLVVAVAAAVAVIAVSGAGATPVGGDLTKARTLVPEVIDMGVTGRRSSGPGPAGVAGEGPADGDGAGAPPPAHALLTLAVTAAPTALNYQHVQGGFVRSEPASSRPLDEDALQRGLTRRKREHDGQPLPDQEAEATSRVDEDADDDDAADPDAAASSHPGADDGDMFLEPDDAAAPAAPAAPATTTEDTTGQPQNLFPAFQPLFPLGHSRPPIFQVSEEPAFSQRQALLRPQQFGGFHSHALGHHLVDGPVREPRLEQGAYAATGLGSGLGPPSHGFRERAYPQPAAAAAPVAAPAEVHSNALLGSGNFGVIHGGTFYGEEKEAQDYDSPSAPLNSYYGGNGHGRPAFYRGNPEPQRYRTSEDFFANFRDFADISTPTKSSFSEYYVVYVNRNASRADPGTVVGPQGVVEGSRTHLQQQQQQQRARPNNIFERLAQIDQEHASDAKQQQQESPSKKLSLGKRKLALLDKKKKKSTPEKAVTISSLAETATAASKDAHEPLLALS